MNSRIAPATIEKKGTMEPSSLAGSASCRAATKSEGEAVGVGLSVGEGDGDGLGLSVGLGETSGLGTPAVVVRAAVEVVRRVEPEELGARGAGGGAGGVGRPDAPAPPCWLEPSRPLAELEPLVPLSPSAETSSPSPPSRLTLPLTLLLDPPVPAPPGMFPPRGSAQLTPGGQKLSPGMVDCAKAEGTTCREQRRTKTTSREHFGTMAA